MIIIEDNIMIERRYSDKNVKLRQIETDTLWNDAVDIKPSNFTYEETDIPVDKPDPDIEEKAEAYDILMGVDE